MKQKVLKLSVFLSVMFLFQGTLIAQHSVSLSNNHDGADESYIVKDESALKNIDDYCIPVGECSEYGMTIADFAFAGIENYESGCSDSGYGDFTDLVAEVTGGETYTVSIATGFINEYISIWIDFNTDSEFSSDELILTDFHIEWNGVLQEVGVFIPVDVITTNTTMRVGANFQENSSPDPCATFAFGEWEDYSINITGLVGDNEVTFHVMEPDASNYEGAFIQFFEQSGTTDSNGEYTFTGISLGTFPYSITLEDNNYYDVQGEVEVVDPTTTVEVELLPNTDVERNFVIIEEWTATWCYGCPAAANGLEEVIEAGYDVGIIAYHNGDDYSTGNDMPRMDDLYNRMYLPSVCFDGIFGLDCEGDSSESCFDTYEPIILEQIDITSPYDISFTNTSLNGDEFTATVKVSYPGFSYAEDVHLLVAITESDIPEQWEGMEYVHFVERGMFPDFNGTLINLEQNGEVEVDVNFTIDASWVVGNMEVVAFVQDFESHEILNGVASPIQTVGMGKAIIGQNIQLFPNPASDKVYIKTNVNTEKVQLINFTGQLVMEKKTRGNKTEINTSLFEPGIYFVKVFSQDNVITRKLVIE